MKLQLTDTNGKVFGTQADDALKVNLELMPGDFLKFLDEDRLNEWFEKGLYEYTVGGKYSVTWDSRHPNAQAIDARLGSIGFKYWRFASKEWRVDLLTILRNGDGSIHNIITDAEIEGALIQGNKIRLLNGNHGNCWIYHNGTLFRAGKMRVYWIPI